MFKMASHDPFGHLKHKLWPKEGLRVKLGVKLVIWLPTTKSQESTRFPCMWHIVGKFSTRVITLLQTSSRLEVCTESYGTQSCGKPYFGNFGILGTKCHLDVGLVERHIIYYKGEGGGFPQVLAVVNLLNPSLPMVCPNTKSALTMH
jgi:hypothetical protein